jgi:type I restriction enzyme R subunit
VTPEFRARQKIDALLIAAGWVIQDRADINLGAGLGVAVREYPLPAGPCDYLLFVDRRACRVIEAKPQGQTLTGAAEQSDDYTASLPAHIQSWGGHRSKGASTLYVARAVGAAIGSMPWRIAYEKARLDRYNVDII